jgi:HK97 family phage major capsid protein
MQNARRFFSLTRGKPVVNVTADDLKEYQAYRSAFAQYLRKGEQALGDREINAALSTGAAPNGGFWLTPDSSGKIVEYLEDLSSMRRLASVSPIGTDTFEGNYDLDEASSGWVGETDTRSETNTPRIDGKYSFPIFEQYANPKASQKMLDDSENDVESWLAKKVAQKLAKTENTAFVTGDGITKPKGFTTVRGGHAGAHVGRGYRKIRQLATGVSGGFAASKPGDKLIDMIQAIPSALRGGGVHDEPADGCRDPEAGRRSGQLPVHPRLLEESERLDPRLPGRRAERHGRHRREFALDRLRQLQGIATRSRITSSARACCAIRSPPSRTSRSTRRSTSVATS